MNSPREIEVPFVRFHRLNQDLLDDPAHVLLLDSAKSKSHRVEVLLERLREEGLVVDTSISHEPAHLRLDSYDLILLSVSPIQYEHIVEVLDAIRRVSRAPVVLLTEQHTLDWFVSAVRAGADAVADAYTPDDVLLAHCRALLRRWRSPP